MNARLEHIGIAVTEPGRVRDFLFELLGLTVYKVETVESEAVATHFISAGGAKLELLESTSPDSPVARFLERRGEGIHHLAFEVPNLSDVLDRAATMGLTPINPEPKDGADGKRIFFLHPRETHGILIEICQSDRFSGVTTALSSTHGDVAVYEAGSQTHPALLLMHDAGSTGLADFGDVMSRLETSVRVICLDSPVEEGQGVQLSQWSQTVTAGATATLDTLDVHAPVVAGLRLGANAGVSLATQVPDRIRGVVLIDPDSSLLDSADLTTLASRACPVLIISLSSATLKRSLRLLERLPAAEIAVIPESADRASVLAAILSDFTTAVQN